MLFLQVNNLLDIFGQPDYKGLDIDQIVTGSPSYPNDFAYCVMATNEPTVPTHPDIVILTEDEYVTKRQTIESNLKSISVPDKIETLESQNAQMLLALVNGGLM
jgi:hypothetical protein